MENKIIFDGLCAVLFHVAIIQNIQKTLSMQNTAALIDF